MEFWASIFIVAFGSLGHFLFEWLGHRKWAGVLFAVNESTWEHIKLAIYPSFLWMIAEVVVRSFSVELLVAQFLSMLTAMLLIPGLFYGYTAITKKNWLIPDIICFVIAVAVSRWGFAVVMDAAVPGFVSSCAAGVISGAGLIAILAMYLFFSYNPPHCFLFRDPVSDGFGPKGHDCHSHFHDGTDHHHH